MIKPTEVVERMQEQEEYRVTDLIPGSDIIIGMVPDAKEPSGESIFGENESLKVDMEIEKQENRENYMIIPCEERIIDKGGNRE